MKSMNKKQRKIKISLEKFCLENDLGYVLEEWDYENNDGKTPKDYSYGSQIRRHWICKLGHKWECVIGHRTSTTQKDKCPYCSNHKLLKGFNDLRTKYPEIAAQWHPSKNGQLTPEDTMYGSNLKIWWKCSRGHEWQVSPNSRLYYHTGCPYCSNKKVLAGDNDLGTLRPELAQEWHPYKNGDLTPSKVTVGSKKKVWWYCSNGHEWKATIQDRANNHGCPKCSEGHHVSFGEKAIFFYLKKICNDTLENYKIPNTNKLELDVFIPSLNIGVEYDGAYFHKNSNRDIKKYKACQDKYLYLIRVREYGCENCKDLADKIITIKYGDNDDLKKAILLIFDLLEQRYSLNCSVDVNIQRDSIEIYNLITLYEKEISLENKFSNIAQEWHPNRNGNLTPAMFSYGSGTMVWWKCSKGHEWQERICIRTSKEYGCPICSGKKIVPGINDLATKRPDLVPEWMIVKNLPMKVDCVSQGSAKKAWWKCSKCQYEWEARISARVHSNSGCPVCAGKIIVTGYNDLATLDPQLASQWNYDKNGGLTPDKVGGSSAKKIWWKCKLCGYEWSSSVYYRNKYKTVCPNCKHI